MAEAQLQGPIIELRQDKRLLTILRVGKLITDRIEELCLIRNIAAGGAMIEADSRLAVRQRVRIELRRDKPLWGTVLWVTPPIAGIAFDERVEIADLLVRGDHRRGHPRLTVPSTARLVVADAIRHVTVCDVSQKGVGIAIDEVLGAGDEVLVALEGMEPVQGTVRWCGHGFAGIEFARPMSLGMLTGWLRKTFGRCSIQRSFGSPDPRTGDSDVADDMGRLLQLI